MFTIDLLPGYNGDYDKYMTKTFNTVEPDYLKCPKKANFDDFTDKKESINIQN